jgi:hypothetical protein
VRDGSLQSLAASATAPSLPNWLLLRRHRNQKKRMILILLRELVEAITKAKSKSMISAFRLRKQACASFKARVTRRLGSGLGQSDESESSSGLG